MKSVLNEHDMNLKEELGKMSNSMREWADEDNKNVVFQKVVSPSTNDGKNTTPVKSKMCSIS